jgi:hypothetical protein
MMRLCDIESDISWSVSGNRLSLYLFVSVLLPFGSIYIFLDNRTLAFAGVSNAVLPWPMKL